MIFENMGPNKIPVFIFMGAPGAGKGTQSVYLSQAKGIPKISTGDMLRSAVQHDSDLGKKVKSIMAEGKLVDDATMLSLIEHRIDQQDCKNGFILDGYPRNTHQAAQLEKVLRPEMRLCVIDIEVPEDEIVKRVVGRRVCPQCETIYNIHFHAPKKDEVCDRDGSSLLRRQDDNEDVIRKRLATYQKETFPLIDYYRQQGVLEVVNGLQLEEEVSRVILQRMVC